MKFKHRAALIAAAFTIGGLVASPSSVGASDADPTQARFEGRSIDLSRDWEEATACVELPDVVDCFRTEEQLLEAYPHLGRTPAPAAQDSTAGSGAQGFAASCSSSLRLYRGTSYSGSALYLTSRLTYHNLSSYGFDNDTSSYKVGACSASFFAGSNGGGSTYPGSTSANSQSTSMVSGWNNVVSSVFIY